MEVIVKKQIQEGAFSGNALIVTTDELTMGVTIFHINSMPSWPRDNSVNFFFTMRLKHEELLCKCTFLSFDKINEGEDFSLIRRGIKSIDEYLRLIVTLINEHLICPEKEILKEDEKNMFIISMSDASLQRHVLVVEKDNSGWHINHDSWSWDGMKNSAEKRFLDEQKIGTRFFFVQAPGF